MDTLLSHDKHSAPSDLYWTYLVAPDIGHAVQGGTTLDHTLDLFLSTMFHADDVIEIRAIECWRTDNRRQSKVVTRDWLTAKEVLRSSDSLRELNAIGANIYFGVNPRATKAGTKQSVRLVRSVWADFDGIALNELENRLPPVLQTPSVVLSSGHGFHCYWSLDGPHDISRSHVRDEFEGMLRSLYKSLGSDSVCDTSRLLRLPGFMNVKDKRNGLPPSPCELLVCCPERKIPLAGFLERWKPEKPFQTDMRRSPAEDSQASGNVSRRVRGILAVLDRGDTRDRSRTDFWVVCQLLRAGFPPDEIRELVDGKSKFQTDKYFDVTLRNALKSVSSK